MLKNIDFDLTLFRDQSAPERKRSRKALLWLMTGLSKINEGIIRSYGAPPLYESGVVYKPERGTEVWRDIPNILADGWGDCEDLACWRIAELNCAGIKATPFIKWSFRPDGRIKTYHAVLRVPDGRIEDPSRALGMHGHPMVRRPVYIDEGPTE